jgi:hypothetical protein
MALRWPQLDDQTRAVLGDPSRNRCGPGNPVALSMICKGFRGDGEAATGTVAAAVGRWPPLPADPQLRDLACDGTRSAQPRQRPE